MSFLNSDNNNATNDNNTPQPVVVRDANQSQPTQDVSDIVTSPDQSGVNLTAPTVPNNPNDVTITTNEGSTLHTFNDPSLSQPAIDNSQLDQETDPNDPIDFSTLNQNPAPMDAGEAALADGVNFTDVDAISSDSLDSMPSSPAVDEQVQLGVSDVSSGEPVPLGVANGVNSSELDEIKKQALEQLRPLLEKVDLPATEKFDKYLMMLRATDDSTLIQPAFNAAQSIDDEKDKAEALVDIINEINYVSNGTTEPEHTFKS